VIRPLGLFKKIAKIADMADCSYSIMKLSAVLPEFVLIGYSVFYEVIGARVAPLPFPLDGPCAIIRNL
jgi:hypothetical protein